MSIVERNRSPSNRSASSTHSSALRIGSVTANPCSSSWRTSCGQSSWPIRAETLSKVVWVIGEVPPESIESFKHVAPWGIRRRAHRRGDIAVGQVGHVAQRDRLALLGRQRGEL